MKKRTWIAALIAAVMLLSLCLSGAAPAGESGEITVTDGIGREVTVTPGSYQRVVCIGAGALRMYSYVGDAHHHTPHHHNHKYFH